jgi:hypothetical protein
MKRKASGDKTFILTLSPKTDISDECVTKVVRYLVGMRNMLQCQIAVECQTKDKDTGTVIDCKRHLHAYLHFRMEQTKAYVIDELKKIMDQTGHSLDGDGTGPKSRDLKVCYEWRDYLSKYDKTELKHGEEFDIDAFKDDFPSAERQQELQKRAKTSHDADDNNNVFIDMEKDLRAMYGDKLYAGVIYHYVNRRINVDRTLPPMRDERTLREFVKKLHSFVNQVTMKKSCMKWCHELDLDAGLTTDKEPADYINTFKEVLAQDGKDQTSTIQQSFTQCETADYGALSEEVYETPRYGQLDQEGYAQAM